MIEKLIRAYKEERAVKLDGKQERGIIEIKEVMPNLEIKLVC